MRGGDVPVANVLANDRSVFSFHQSVVLSPIGPALGELDQQALEQLRHFVVDVLRTVVGMETHDFEGKLMQDRFQHRAQMLLADPAHATYYLPLSYRVYRIDVIDAFDAVPIALMHGVDAEKPWPPLRIWLAPLPDRYRARTRR